jgi:hypothetical protein
MLHALVRTPPKCTFPIGACALALAIEMFADAAPACAQPQPAPPPGSTRSAPTAPGAESAPAQSGEVSQAADQEARAHFEKGREAYNDGRYRDAWAEFHQAYKLSGRPELLFNIGQTADRLGREEDAIKSFELYLKHVPGADNRRDVENRVRALKERVSEARTQEASKPTPLPPPPAAGPQPAPDFPGATSPTPGPAPRYPGWDRNYPSTPVQEFPGAEGEDERGAERARAEEAERTRRHGLYLRAAVGGGFRYAASSSDDDNTDDATTSVYGLGLTLDFGVGWGVLPGFAIGAGVFLDTTSRPTFKNDDLRRDKLDHMTLLTIGPFVDYYPGNRNAGFHIQGGLGFASLSYRLGNRRVDPDNPTGISGFIAAGFEGRIASPLALGIMLRFTGAVLSGPDVWTGNGKETHVVLSPSLLVSATWF